MVFGMFMAILDIQIVSASLSEIQAGLSASQDEITWVQTSYLIAEVIMIPLSGFLSRAFSTRTVFVASAAGFTLMSFLCSRASSIDEMIVWRAAQGFIGGGMIPTVFASAYTIFPRSKMALIAPIIGLVATLAPTIGPTAGGYLTDLFSWHWLFLVNIVPGIIVSVATWFLIDFDKPDLKLLKNFDWTGLVAMAAFLGALEYALEEGPSKDWLESEPVTAALVISGLGGDRLLLARVHGASADRRPHRLRRPQFLDRHVARLRPRHRPLRADLHLSRLPRGGARLFGADDRRDDVRHRRLQFLMAPISGRLMGKVDPRLMIAVGFVGFAVGTWQASFITADWDFWELLVPQMLRGFSLMLCMVPINNLALGTMPPQRIKNASGLFNLMRNLGGAFGLALINTTLDKRMDLHLERLREAVVWGRSAADERLAELTAAMAARGSDAALAATRALALTVRRQAEVMALGDVFLALTLVFLAFVGLAAFMRRPQMAAVGGGH